MSSLTDKSQDSDVVAEMMEKILLLTSVDEDIDSLLRSAFYIAHSGTDTIALLAASKKACSLAARHFVSLKALQVLYQVSEILYEYFTFLQFDELPEKTLCGNISQILKELINMTINLQKVDSNMMTKVKITFIFCLSAFQYATKCFAESQNLLNKAMSILDIQFGLYETKTVPYGRAAFHRTRILRNNCSTPEQICVYKKLLRASFDAFFSDLCLYTDDTKVFEFYCLVFDIAVHDKSLLEKRFLFYIYDNLMSRRYYELSDVERFLHNVSVIWVLKLLGMDKSSGGHYVKILNKMNLPIPCKKLLKPVSEASLALVAFKLIPGTMVLKKKLFIYARSLISRSMSSVRKIRQLNILAAAITFNEDLNSDAHFYLSFLKAFMFELTKEDFSIDCAWFCRRMCFAHLYFSVFFDETGRYDKCLQHAKQLTQTLSEYTGKHDEDLKVIKASAFYVSAFANHKMGNYIQASEYIGMEITLLKELQPQQVKRLLVAQTHKKYIDEVLHPCTSSVIQIPEGLVKLFLTFSPPTQE